MEILEYILNPELLPGIFFNIYVIIKFLFMIAAVSLLTLIIFLLTKTDWLYIHYLEDFTEISKMKTYEVSLMSKEWKKIKKKAEKATESERKLAVLDADKLLERALTRFGYEGKTSGEKIKQCEDIDKEIWEAHQIRSDIVHDPSIRLSEEVTRKALMIYERALEKLKAI